MLQKVIILILTSIFLVACAAQRADYRLDAGKGDFTDGNYKKSFHELLPLALQGNPPAEYAIGYMYYYGYGVAIDTDAGIAWMERAANQGSAPAQKALLMINTKRPSVPLPVTPASPNY